VGRVVELGSLIWHTPLRYVSLGHDSVANGRHRMHGHLLGFGHQAIPLASSKSCCSGDGNGHINGDRCVFSEELWKCPLVVVSCLGIFPPASFTGFGSTPLAIRDMEVGDNRFEFGARNWALVFRLLKVAVNALTQAS